MSTAQISRRYARALFDLVQEGSAVRKDVAALAAVAANEEVQAFLASPQYPAAMKLTVLEKAAGKLSAEGKRLAEMLCERGKATLLPEIAALLEEMIRQAESEVEAEVVAAVKLDAELQKKVAGALTRLVGRKVRLKVREDASILGGLIINVGDRKIDYSLRTRLTELHRALAA
ncbi:MAG: ATP synthase F1 subunit delta [Mariprofundaceae bacterium]|nr:ATP synthase F1 subunit delta [Mariprofundaceae bacterium]